MMKWAHGDEYLDIAAELHREPRSTRTALLSASSSVSANTSMRASKRKEEHHGGTANGLRPLNACEHDRGAWLGLPLAASASTLDHRPRDRGHARERSQLYAFQGRPSATPGANLVDREGLAVR